MPMLLCYSSSEYHQNLIDMSWLICKNTYYGASGLQRTICYIPELEITSAYYMMNFNYTCKEPWIEEVRCHKDDLSCCFN